MFPLSYLADLYHSSVLIYAIARYNIAVSLSLLRIQFSSTLSLDYRTGYEPGFAALTLRRYPLPAELPLPKTNPPLPSYLPTNPNHV